MTKKSGLWESLKFFFCLFVFFRVLAINTCFTWVSSMCVFVHIYLLCVISSSLCYFTQKNTHYFSPVSGSSRNSFRGGKKKCTQVHSVCFRCEYYWWESIICNPSTYLFLFYFLSNYKNVEMNTLCFRASSCTFSFHSLFSALAVL